MTAEETPKRTGADPTGLAAHGQVTLRGTLPGFVMGLVGPMTAGVGNVPWEVAIYTSTLGAALIGLQFVFPQKSKDRLDWWIDLRRSRERAAARRLARRRAQCVGRRYCAGRTQDADKGHPQVQERGQLRGSEDEQRRAQADPDAKSSAVSEPSGLRL